jgi:hypothetical protein
MGEKDGRNVMLLARRYRRSGCSEVEFEDETRFGVCFEVVGSV